MTKPDFLLIPMLVYEHPKLSPTDKVIYAVVYWFEHMRDGICKASNRKIAEIALVDDRTVRVGLERLEEAGFIRRDFRDKARKIRAQIRCLVAFSRTEPREEIPEEQTSLAGMPDVRPETPKQFAARFFEGDEQAITSVVEDIIAASAGKIPRDPLVREIRKFTAYWTEPNGSGTKQLWQMKPTFEVKRRLYTWLGRSTGRSHAVRSSAGAGVTLCALT